MAHGFSQAASHSQLLETEIDGAASYAENETKMHRSGRPWRVFFTAFVALTVLYAAATICIICSLRSEVQKLQGVVDVLHERVQPIGLQTSDVPKHIDRHNQPYEKTPIDGSPRELNPGAEIDKAEVEKEFENMKTRIGNLQQEVDELKQNNPWKLTKSTEGSELLQSKANKRTSHPYNIPRRLQSTDSDVLSLQPGVSLVVESGNVEVKQGNLHVWAEPLEEDDMMAGEVGLGNLIVGRGHDWKEATNSVIIGLANKVAGNDNFVAGYLNVATDGAKQSSILGGQTNTVSSPIQTVLGGAAETADGLLDIVPKSCGCE